MKYGLIAERLSHSYSREVHARLGNPDYELLELPPEEVVPFLQRRDFLGLNVTIPYKTTVMPHLDEIDEAARSIGAVNTIVNRNGRLYGYNTDFYGLVALIRRCGWQLDGEKVLVLGSGGTSRTAVSVVNYLGAAAAYRVSRTGRDGCITYEDAVKNHADAAYIINTTPCGMAPNLGESAVNVNDFTDLKGVLDVIYNPLRSRLVCDAQAKGIPAVGGLYMLVAQAAYAMERFMDVSISADKTAEIYRQIAVEKQNIVLLGMPGCGKTTVGRRLAEILQMDFVDTDAEIQRQEGRSIPDIFAACGENGFRDIEQAVIRQVAARRHTVIATGGGAVLREENCRILRENGRLYFLDRPLEDLVSTADRPLSSNRQDLERRYAERYPLYCRLCDRHIAADTVETTVNAIKEDVINEDFSD